MMTMMVMMMVMMTMIIVLMIMTQPPNDDIVDMVYNLAVFLNFCISVFLCISVCSPPNRGHHQSSSPCSPRHQHINAPPSQPKSRNFKIHNCKCSISLKNKQKIVALYDSMIPCSREALLTRLSWSCKCQSLNVPCICTVNLLSVPLVPLTSRPKATPEHTWSPNVAKISLLDYSPSKLNSTVIFDLDTMYLPVPSQTNDLMCSSLEEYYAEILCPLFKTCNVRWNSLVMNNCLSIPGQFMKFKQAVDLVSRTLALSAPRFAQLGIRSPTLDVFVPHPIHSSFPSMSQCNRHPGRPSVCHQCLFSSTTHTGPCPECHRPLRSPFNMAFSNMTPPADVQSPTAMSTKHPDYASAAKSTNPNPIPPTDPFQPVPIPTSTSTSADPFQPVPVPTPVVQHYKPYHRPPPPDTPLMTPHDMMAKLSYLENEVCAVRDETLQYFSDANPKIEKLQVDMRDYFFPAPGHSKKPHSKEIHTINQQYLEMKAAVTAMQDKQTSILDTLNRIYFDDNKLENLIRIPLQLKPTVAFLPPSTKPSKQPEPLVDVDA